MKKTILWLLVATILTQSCATLLTGSYQRVNFKSNKDGTVYQNLKEIGKTNSDISVKRSDLIKLYTVKSPGCPDTQFELPVGLNGAFLINIPLAFVGIGILTAYMDVSRSNQLKTNPTIQVEVKNCVE